MSINWENRHVEDGCKDEDATAAEEDTAKRVEFVLVCILQGQRAVTLQLEGFAHFPVCEGCGNGAEPGENHSAGVGVFDVCKDR